MRKEKLQEFVLNALTYCRLQGDVYAVEAEIAEKSAAPTEPPVEEKNSLKKLWGSLTKELKKDTRREETRDLTAERQQAVSALAAYQASCSKKETALAENPEKLKKILNKKLFKKDGYGLKRMQFALAAVVSDGNSYRRPEESLEVASEILFDDPKKWGELYRKYRANCAKLQAPDEEFAKEELEANMIAGLGIFSLLTLSPLGLGVAGVTAAAHAYRRHERQGQVRALTVSEQTAFLAMKLTLLEEGRAVMNEAAFKVAVDEFLQRLSGLRADAEYGWLVEKMDAPACIEKIQTYDLCIERLAELLGI